MIGLWLMMLMLGAAPQADEHTVLLLHCDEGVGDVLRDASSQGLPVRLDVPPRRPAWADGRFGKCLRFDGANEDADGDGKGDADGLLVEGQGKLAQAGPVTLEMWIAPQRVEGTQTLWALNTLNGRYTLFLSGRALELWMAFAGDGDKPAYKSLRTAPLVEVDTWQHVAVSYDGGSMRAWLNGVEVAQVEAPGQRFQNETVAITTLGRDGDLRPVSGGIRGYQGLIDEVRISNVAREQFDVPEELVSQTRAALAAAAQLSRFAKPYPDAPAAPVRERDVVVTGRVKLDGQAAPGVQVSDGEQVVSTDAGGRYRLAFHVAENRFVTLSRPSGTRPVGPWTVLIDPAAATTEYQLDFGLASDPASARPRFSFLQTSDSQFTTPEDMELIREDYAQMTAMTGEPGFLVCPGDLTMNGTHYELDMYQEIAKAARIDLYNVFGGHDGNYAAPKYSVANYERKIGPPHFSWNYGGVHFMAWVTEMHYLSEDAKARQARWIENDLAAQPPGTPVLLVTHIPPARAQLDQWLARDYRLIGMLFGHWHAITQNRYRDIPLLNCSPIRGGDWGQLTRAFRINTIEDGKLAASEVRPTGQVQRLELLSPASGGWPAPLRVLAFDSACRVTSVHATLRPRVGAGAAVAVDLRPLGQWTWGIEMADLKPPAGDCVIDIRARDEGGREWRLSPEVAAAVPAPAVIVKEDWPSLLGSSGPVRTAAAPLAPPLRPAWVVNTGGRNQLGVSPIIWRGRVIVGVQTHDVGWRGAGVSCHDAATGRREWFTPLDSSVRVAPAVIAGVLVAVTHQGVVHGLDPQTGRKLWEHDLYPEPPGNIYRSVNKPVVACGDRALVARDDAGAVLLDPATGRVEREFGGVAGIYYAFPTATADRLFFGARQLCQAYDLASGERLWEVPATTGKATSAPVLHEGRLYLNAASLHCYNPADGALLWKRPVPVGSNAVALPVFWRHLVIANGSMLRAFDRVSGEPAWEFAYPSPASAANRRQSLAGMSAPVVAGDIIYAGSDNGHLYALEAATGKVLWSYALGLPVKSWPAVSGNALFLSDCDGNLWAFVSDRR